MRRPRKYCCLPSYQLDRAAFDEEVVRRACVAAVGRVIVSSGAQITQLPVRFSPLNFHVNSA